MKTKKPEHAIVFVSLSLFRKFFNIECGVVDDIEKTCATEIIHELLMVQIMSRWIENVLEVKSTVIEQKNEMLHRHIKPRCWHWCSDKYRWKDDRDHVRQQMLHRMSVPRNHFENQQLGLFFSPQILRSQKSDWSRKFVVLLVDVLVEKLWMKQSMWVVKQNLVNVWYQKDGYDILLKASDVMAIVWLIRC